MIVGNLSFVINARAPLVDINYNTYHTRLAGGISYNTRAQPPTGPPAYTRIICRPRAGALEDLFNIIYRTYARACAILDI